MSQEVAKAGVKRQDGYELAGGVNNILFTLKYLTFQIP